jgi:DNA adenine methylase
MKYLKAPFCRQGNKYPLLDEIIPYIPPHMVYVELFAGSGVVLFNKEKAKINVLNDLDKDTIDRFKLLKKAPIDQTLYRQDLNTLPKIKQFYNHHSNSLTDQMLYTKIQACNGFSGKPVKTSNMIYVDRNPANNIKYLPEYKKKLKGVKLYSKDYQQIVEQYDSPYTFFFIDPPYENTSTDFGYAQSSHFDFERFASVVHHIKGMFMLTINDSPYTRKLFKGYNIRKVSVANTWRNGNLKSNLPKRRHEIIVTNY